MTTSEVAAAIKQIDPEFNPAYVPTAFDAFCEEMKDKHYGADPCAQAWYFFLQGWIARWEWVKRHMEAE